MSIALTPEELRELTGKTRSDAQARVLVALGIAARVRPDGSLLVDREVYRAWAGAAPSATVEKKRARPRFAA